MVVRVPVEIFRESLNRRSKQLEGNRQIATPRPDVRAQPAEQRSPVTATDESSRPRVLVRSAQNPMQGGTVASSKRSHPDQISVKWALTDRHGR
jgi:hypothetical protein